ncbi:MAG: PAQR family membrane homeostasis protein TrhA [Acidimicrobiales bacterium]
MSSWRPTPATDSTERSFEPSRDSPVPTNQKPAPTVRRARPSGSAETPRLRGWPHFVGSVLAIPAGAALVVRSLDTPATAQVAIYSVGMLLLFVTSASYHLVPMPARVRRLMRRADHAMIFVFIAACYTPWCVLVVHGTLAEVVLIVAWAGAGVGFVGKLAGFNRLRPVTGTLYIVLGWIGVVTLPDAFSVLSPAELGLMWSFALLYTAGAVVLLKRWPDPAPETFGYHEVWHSMVVAAAACYWLVLWGLLGGIG